MNKKKWAEKSNDLQNFEEQTLSSVKERFAKYENVLTNLGLALDIDLSWFNRQEDKEVSFSRINFKDGYICNIDIAIRRQEEPERDLDLICLCFIYPISQVGRSFLRWIFGLPISFSKVPEKILKEFLDDTEDSIKKVIDKGYETVLEEAKESDKQLK